VRQRATGARRDISRGLDRSWASRAGRRSLNASMALRIARGVTGARLLYRYAAAHPGVALARIWLLLPGDIWDSVSCPPMLRPVGVLKV